ncbi:MAG TPA: NADH-quinone oxidoreductase subunit NuoG [Candidatus Dormibacteraeota bacterium]|nr:NADH-quinone oxidoreductase subunit NuoG [Candidatus Dormibacteraeota bacterium]
MADVKQITLKINDREVKFPAGTLVIEATRRMGIEVPSFCYYPGLSLQAACRMCLVEVEKAPKLQTACTLVVMEGMVIRTETEQVKAARKGMLEFLLTNHPLDCPVCDKGGECELQDMVFRYGADASRFVEEKIHSPEEKWSEVVYYDAPRCILCFRCVRVCDEGMDVKALGVGQRGALSVIIPNGEDHLECEECGMCIDICPVGALTSGTYRYKTRPWEMKYVPTVCTHCSNGCKTTLSVRNNKILRANNRDLSGINQDFLCIKGRFGFDFAEHPERLTLPLVRQNGKLLPTSWEDASRQAAIRLKTIFDAHGGNAIGFIGSNRTTNEENYLLQRLARATFGTNNVDHHRTADYAGLVTALGEQASQATATIKQLGEAKAIFLIGNDPTEQNPLVAWQIRSAVRHQNAKLYIINSNPIKLRSKARHFVHIAPGTEGSVVRWLARGEGGFDDALTKNLTELKNLLASEAEVVIVFGSEVTGAAVEELVTLGSTLAGKTRYMALGDYSNSRGAADMGLLPDRLPGHARLDDGSPREQFGTLWGATLSEKAGLSAQKMLEGTQSGALKALYVVGANPVKTFAASKDGGRGKLELLIVQEMFLSETAELADIVFPAKCAYEKDGTVTNTAGELQLLRKGGDIMGPRSDFDLLRIISHQLAILGLGSAFHYKSAEAVFDEIRKNVRGYDVQMTGLITGGAEATAPQCARNGHGPHDIPPGQIFSSADTLFTSGTLGRYCKMIESLPEAEAKP